jgi:hypothetical protein
MAESKDLSTRAWNLDRVILLVATKRVLVRRHFGFVYLWCPSNYKPCLGINKCDNIEYLRLLRYDLAGWWIVFLLKTKSDP